MANEKLSVAELILTLLRGVDAKALDSHYGDRAIQVDDHFIVYNSWNDLWTLMDRQQWDAMEPD